MNQNTSSDPRVFFAAERTFLAWIRTGLALMGFGFVVARFGIFLQQLVLDRGQTPAASSGMSVGLGVALVATGVVANVVAAWHHVRLVGALRRGEGVVVRPSALAVGLALALAIVGLLMAGYLIHARPAGPSAVPSGVSMPVQPHDGIIFVPSAHSIDETIERLMKLLEERKITLFAVVDHSGEAAKVGMAMPTTRLLIFGNPKGGTPVMLAAPSSAIDLPLKLLVSQTADGSTRISYNDPKYLQERHHFPAELMGNLRAAGDLAELAAR